MKVSNSELKAFFKNPVLRVPDEFKGLGQVLEGCTLTRRKETPSMRPHRLSIRSLKAVCTSVPKSLGELPLLLSCLPPETAPSGMRTDQSWGTRPSACSCLVQGQITRKECQWDNLDPWQAVPECDTVI